MTTNDNGNLVKFSNGFHCEICNHTTYRKYNLDLHFESKRHKNNTLTTKNNESLVKTSKKIMCLNCDKEFNDRAGLWRHKKKCKAFEEKKTDNEISDKELIIMLIKQNSELIKETTEFKNMMMKVLENGTHNTTNSHNKSFNLQFFLNETCKDAMNIMDFVNSIQLQLSDLERVGELGYVEGISNIIVKNLKELDITLRPFHCTDKKREIIYIKDENKWEKDENKKKMHKLIQKIATKNACLLRLKKNNFEIFYNIIFI
jgi:hypothetical protein